MDRRTFLLGTGAALGQILAGCSSQERQRLQVQVLKGSIPAQLLEQFRRQLKQSANLDFVPVEQFKAVLDLLQLWHKQPPTKDGNWQLPAVPLINPKPPQVADLVTLGDFWLQNAIAQNLIQPLAIENLPQWSKLPSRWQNLVRRNEQGFIDPQGKIWAAPYRWGSTVIAYNRQKMQSLGWTPTNWEDLWRKELQGRISLLNQPREVIGLTLKKLGYSYNTKDLQQVPQLDKQLSALHKQTKVYSSDRYMEPLILGDTWVAVGWSTDVIPVIQRYQEIAAVVPQAGTAIWADTWVSPAKSKANNSLVSQWIDFCWQQPSQKQIAVLSKAASPLPLNINAGDIQEGLRNLLLVAPEVFERSEFLLPLSPETQQQYDELWKSAIL
ncbi:extracellular solute-binding protein [Aliterella atlantica]|uniref:Polyamine ABC transporter substrate-binding protein n=1 Tax=Aliterella atlantica CENA595 TaxID=1618023 RepID=A0A0D8ZS18_9CYAN|nr:extracellular solute-binding protein [Aliterella atlantica]KJH71142.1 polyamine ABC transporter substrate-binding protein [Aliterella atlantica CENA595]